MTDLTNLTYYVYKLFFNKSSENIKINLRVFCFGFAHNISSLNFYIFEYVTSNEAYYKNIPFRYLFNCGEGTQRLAHEYK